MQLKWDGSVSPWFTAAFLGDYTIQKGPEIKVPAQGVYSKSPQNCTNTYVDTNLPPQSFGARQHWRTEDNADEHKS